MSPQLNRGDKVVAKGKLATVEKIFSEKSIKVVLVSTGESIVVSLSEIEFIDAPPTSALKTVLSGRLLTDFKHEELELAARRFTVIKKWRAGEITLAEASVELDVTGHHLYKLAKLFNEDIGSLSMLLQKRGRKHGANKLEADVEEIIVKATRQVYKGRGASYRKVWTEVQVSCDEKKLNVPSKDTIIRRIKSLLTEKERSRIKQGADLTNQKYQARPGKKKTFRPLEWVQMDHTLVDVILLADNRRDIIGRPWLTVLIDVYTRVVLGYYISLHAPSAVTVACALTHAVLAKNSFVKKLGLEPDDYPYYGVPTALHMDNAVEFTSPKLRLGCDSFGIDTVYRPMGKKHYGGHIERFIGTMMTSKVHFLKGTTMSNAVARRKLESEKQATMTFSDFASWFAREIIVYHSTVHEETKKSPHQAWKDYFSLKGGHPFPARVSDPLQFKLYFMPEETRVINGQGIEFHGQKYWDPVLSRFVGTKNVTIKYDPYLSENIWVKLDGEFYPIGLSDLTLTAPNYEEYRAAKIYRIAVNAGAIIHPSGKRAYREKQEIARESERLTKRERRKHAAAGIYSEAYPEPLQKTNIKPAVKPNYSKPPDRFTKRDD